MKKSKIILSIFSVLIICISSVFCVSADENATADEAIISQSDDKYVPLYTVSPDNSLNDSASLQFSTQDYQLFYTQTTFLALIAGYLILFKIKGLKNSEKMHRRKK